MARDDNALTKDWLSIVNQSVVILSRVLRVAWESWSGVQWGHFDGGEGQSTIPRPGVSMKLILGRNGGLVTCRLDVLTGGVAGLNPYLDPGTVYCRFGSVPGGTRYWIVLLLAAAPSTGCCVRVNVSFLITGHCASPFYVSHVFSFQAPLG